MKITIIDYDDDGTKNENEIEISPWNILGVWALGKECYRLRMVGQKFPYDIEKEDYEKIIKYIKKKEEQ